MKKRSRAQGSTIFLLELTFSILFFAIASAICVQLFVQSHILSSNAKRLSSAVNTCSAVAETVDASRDMNGLIELLQQTCPDMQCTGDENALNGSLYLSEEFSPAAQGEAAYVLTLDAVRQDTMLLADIQLNTADEKAEQVYSLSLQHHLQRGNGHA